MLEFFLKTTAVFLSILFAAALTLFSPTTIAGDVTLAWDASTSSNVGGYTVHYGLSSGIYPNKVFVGNQTSYMLSSLDSGKTYYIAVTALDANGMGESDFSDEIEVEIPFPDSDGDEMPDVFETANGLDPLNPLDASGDLDEDGLTNIQEFNLGTRANNPDTDNDGVNDGDEVAAGTDPKVHVNVPAVIQIINSILQGDD